MAEHAHPRQHPVRFVLSIVFTLMLIAYFVARTSHSAKSFTLRCERGTPEVMQCTARASPLGREVLARASGAQSVDVGRSKRGTTTYFHLEAMSPKGAVALTDQIAGGADSHAEAATQLTRWLQARDPNPVVVQVRGSLGQTITFGFLSVLMIAILMLIIVWTPVFRALERRFG